MIERYQVEEIETIWSRENIFRKWLDVELAILDVWYRQGLVPEESWRRIKNNAAFDVARIDQIERRVKHDVIAFLTSVEESVGNDSAYLHKGVTSYDIVDTALSLLIRESIDVVLDKARKCRQILLKRAFELRDVLAIGRTHGVHAEPISFGMKFLIWYEEMGRNIARLESARTVVSVGKISGAVGTYSHFPPEGEEKALQNLDLTPCRVSSQIIQRDRHMEVLFALASLGTGLEKIAVEIRHLQRTEVLEVEEPFTQGQKGSSAMPHKRNPVRCERLSGMSRLLRGYLQVAMENNVLWHERDISHSSAERVTIPDAFHCAAFMLEETRAVLADLVIHSDNIEKNLRLTSGIYYSQNILTLLVTKGVPRQKAYELVQKQALAAWSEKSDFRRLIESDETIASHCSKEELAEAFSDDSLVKNIHAVFNRFKDDSV